MAVAPLYGVFATVFGILLGPLLSVSLPEFPNYLFLGVTFVSIYFCENFVAVWLYIENSFAFF
jgi:hypothetical protein